MLARQTKLMVETFVIGKQYDRSMPESLGHLLQPSLELNFVEKRPQHPQTALGSHMKPAICRVRRILRDEIIGKLPGVFDVRQSSELHAHQSARHLLPLLRAAARHLRRVCDGAIDGAVLQSED